MDINPAGNIGWLQKIQKIFGKKPLGKAQRSNRSQANSDTVHISREAMAARISDIRNKLDQTIHKPKVIEAAADKLLASRDLEKSNKHLKSQRKN